MVSYLIAMLIQAGLGSVKPNDEFMDKRTAYYDSCLKGAEKFLCQKYQAAEPSKVLAVATKDCDEMMVFIEKTNAWDMIEDPKFDGCLDAIKLNLKGDPKSDVQQTQRRICGKVQD